MRTPSFPDESYGEDAPLEEAYASYLDARRHFAQLKAARGYFPVVALADGGVVRLWQLDHKLHVHRRGRDLVRARGR